VSLADLKVSAPSEVRRTPEPTSATPSPVESASSSASTSALPSATKAVDGARTLASSAEVAVTVCACTEVAAVSELAVSSPVQSVSPPTDRASGTFTPAPPSSKETCPSPSSTRPPSRIRSPVTVASRCAKKFASTVTVRAVGFTSSMGSKPCSRRRAAESVPSAYTVRLATERAERVVSPKTCSVPKVALESMAP